MRTATASLERRQNENAVGGPMVAIRGLTHRFGREEDAAPVLADIDLCLEPGEIVIMTGPSGSGKTTLLTLIGALRSVQDGNLSVLGRELRGLRQRELVAVRRDIGFIFQDHNLFDSLTALENVRMALELHRRPRAEADAAARELLERLGLGKRTAFKPQDLSGGQRQRVAVARALANHPRLVLADEPTAALDEAAGRAVVDLLRALAKGEGATVMIVTHDPRILDAADRIVSMVDGRIASNVDVQESLAICGFLTRCPIFESMPSGRLTTISQSVTRERYAPGELVIRQGEVGDKFYVVHQGEVSVLVDRGGGVGNVATLGAGDFFGEAALLTGEPRNASVRAMTGTELYALDKASFDAALASGGSFAERLRAELFNRL